MTNSAGTKIEATEYLPFGSQRSHSGTNTSDYLYTDQEYDNTTGLYNYNARLYDPVIGKFISADTVVPDWMDPQALNRFSYCRNNPLIYVDPTGHFWEELGNWLLGNGWLKDVAPENTPPPPPEPPTEEATKTPVIDIVIDVVSGTLTVVDVGLAGPTGEGIAPALLLQSFKVAGKETAKQVAKKSIIKYSDDIAKLSLRKFSLGTGRKKLLQQGLRERITQTGRHEFLDKTGRVRAAWDPKNSTGGNHLHKFAPDGKTPLNEAGHVVKKVEPRAHIPSNK
jgi:RHS repeat-associated protein